MLTAQYVRNFNSEKIPHFRGLRKIASLSVRPLVDSLRTELVERGRQYVKLTGVHHMQYNGVLMVVSFNLMGRKQIAKFDATGRAMLDREGYRKCEPGSHAANMDPYALGCSCPSCVRKQETALERDDEDDDDEEAPEHSLTSTTEAQTVGEDDLALLPPVVFGFSLSLKIWGMMVRPLLKGLVFTRSCSAAPRLEATGGVCATSSPRPQLYYLTRSSLANAFAQTVEEFEPVTFDSGAWDHLELEKSSKDMLKALVEAQNASIDGDSLMINDVIANKGTGTVILVLSRDHFRTALTRPAAW